MTSPYYVVSSQCALLGDRRVSNHYWRLPNAYTSSHQAGDAAGAAQPVVLPNPRYDWQLHETRIRASQLSRRHSLLLRTPPHPSRHMRQVVTHYASTPFLLSHMLKVVTRYLRNSIATSPSPYSLVVFPEHSFRFVFVLCVYHFCVLSWSTLPYHGRVICTLRLCDDVISATPTAVKQETLTHWLQSVILIDVVL